MRNLYKSINKKLTDKKYLLNNLEIFDRKSTKNYTFLNPFSYKVFLENPNLIDEFDVFFADGSLLVRLHNIFNTNKIDRVSFDFSSIAKNVFDFANKNKLNIALIGANYNEIDIAFKNLKIMYSNIRNGYFNTEDEYRECFKE